MAIDWQVGDLAVCVDDSPCSCGFCGGLPRPYAAGKTYEVVGFSGRNQFTGAPMLLLSGLPISAEAHLPGYHSIRFRKIRPDEQAGSREDWELLLDTHKQSVPSISIMGDLK